MQQAVPWRRHLTASGRQQHATTLSIQTSGVYQLLQNYLRSCFLCVSISSTPAKHKIDVTMLPLTLALPSRQDSMLRDRQCPGVSDSCHKVAVVQPLFRRRMLTHQRS